MKTEKNTEDEMGAMFTRLDLWADFITHETLRPLEDLNKTLGLMREWHDRMEWNEIQKEDWMRRAKEELGS